ncbi:hypothetical protein HID58_084993 [Brassica napus]|uniref:DUF7870 domain-containing protein n=1 Tax=Brassica napus TaxID=3708 RepID=A0ABQ7XLD2_BRANA|nr:hypothetical protein HID58_084993 [Brassica napus]
MDIKFTHGFPLNPAAIAAESSQHHLNLLASASSVATTTAVTASNINTASVDLSSVYTAAAAPINSFISPATSVFTSPRGLRSSSQLERAQERECIIPKRKVFIDVGTGKGSIVMMSLEPENMGMKEWLKENVKEEEYVVMKTEVAVLDEMMRS